MSTRASPEAESLYEEFLRERRAGGAGDFEGLCGSRPELAAALRELHESYERAQAIVRRLRPGSAEVSSLGVRPPRDDGLSPATPEPHSSLDWLERPGASEARASLQARGRIGRGGMGEVFEVWDAKLRRTLAMKTLSGVRAAEQHAPADRQRISRFVEEAQVTGQLDHPGIVPVHELGLDEEGRLFFTMPLVRGRNLEQIIALVRAGRDGWTLTRAVGVVVKVCEAMAFAHAKQVVHRDLKPSNVMVGPYGETYVVDWGLARVGGHPDSKDLRLAAPCDDAVAGRAADSPLRTMDGDVIGTPAYMSPEQAAGRIEDVDERSDVYAVGALLYHLLTGRVPYRTATGQRPALEVLAELRRGPPERIESIERGLPAEIVAICERAMAREPAARYPDMLELARDLQAYLDDRVVRAHRTGAVAELRKWVVRNKATAAALLGALLATIGGLAGIAHVQVSGKAALSDSNELLSDANRSLRRSLYFNNVALAQSAYASFNTANMKSLLADCDPDLRGWEWDFLRRLSDASARTLTGHSEKVTAVAFSPDGRRIASGAEDSLVKVWDVATGAQLLDLAAHGDLVDDVAWSPDGRLLASGGHDQVVRLWDADTGDEVAVLEGHTEIVLGVAFSRDGSLLASVGSDATLRLWDVAAKRALRAPLVHEAGLFSVDFSPVADLVAAAGFDRAIHVWDARTGEELAALAGHPHFLRCVEFGPDGARILGGTNGRQIWLWDVARCELVRSAFGRTSTEAVAFSPDGERFASHEYGTIRIWRTETGESLANLYGHDALVYGLAFAPDGGLLASGSADSTVKLWDLRRDPAKTAFAGHADIIESLALTEDSERMATGSRDGTLRIWDVSTGGRLHVIPAGQGWVGSLAFSPDGAMLASGGSDGSVCLREGTTGAERMRRTGHTLLVRTLAFDATGERLVSASYDGTAAVWDVGTGRVELRLEGAHALAHAEFSPDGSWILTGDQAGILRRFDARTGELLHAIQAHGGSGEESPMSPDRTRSEAVNAAGISPDGTRIVSGGGDRLIKVWDVATGAHVFTARGHEHTVQFVTYSPDGERLFSTGYDGFLKVWDAQTGRLALTLQGDDSPLGASALAVSADGRRVAAAGVGGVAYVWDAGEAPTSR